MKAFPMLVLALTLAHASNAQADGDVSLGSVSYAGSGCPQGSVSYYLDDNEATLSLAFTDYAVAVGPATPPNDAKTCVLTVPVQVPAGWRFALEDVGYAAHLVLDTGVWCQIAVSYTFQDSGGPRATNTWWGARDQSHKISDRIEMSTLEWSSCGGLHALTISSRLQVSNTRNRTGYGQMVNDTTLARFVQSYGLRWERCH